MPENAELLVTLSEAILRLSENTALFNFASELMSIANDGDLITPHGIKEIAKRHKVSNLLAELENQEDLNS